jgi:hypothetical protein
MGKIQILVSWLNYISECASYMAEFAEGWPEKPNSKESDSDRSREQEPDNNGTNQTDLWRNRI